MRVRNWLFILASAILFLVWLFWPSIQPTVVIRASLSVGCPHSVNTAYSVKGTACNSYVLDKSETDLEIMIPQLLQLFQLCDDPNTRGIYSWALYTTTALGGTRNTETRQAMLNPYLEDHLNVFVCTASTAGRCGLLSNDNLWQRSVLLTYTSDEKRKGPVVIIPPMTRQVPVSLAPKKTLAHFLGAPIATSTSIHNSLFCVCANGWTLELFNAIAAGCIPVFYASMPVQLPFPNTIHWENIVVSIPMHKESMVLEILKGVNNVKERQLRLHPAALQLSWQTCPTVVLNNIFTELEILQQQ